MVSSTMHLEAAIAIARRGPWLKQQSKEFQHAICSCMSLASVAKGAAVFEAGDESGELFCLVAGSAVTSVVHPIAGPITAALWRPGQWFGQAVCLGKRKRLLSVHATEDCHLLLVKRESIEKLLQANPTFSWNFFDLLVGEYELVVMHGSDMFITDARLRLCARLLTLAGWTATSMPGSPVLIRLSKEELASASGMTRQTVYVQLNRLVSEGICRIGYRAIEIVDIGALADILALSSKSLKDAKG